MKTLLSIIFILTSSFAYTAGTDSGGSSSSSGGSSSSSTVDVNVEFHRAKNLIYKKKYETGLKILKDIEKESPLDTQSPIYIITWVLPQENKKIQTT